MNLEVVGNTNIKTIASSKLKEKIKTCLSESEQNKVDLFQPNSPIHPLNANCFLSGNFQIFAGKR